MTHEEQRIYLIRELLAEEPGYREIEIPDHEEEQKRLLRSLMNIRPPRPISNEFLKIQDEYLKEEVARKGVTDSASLPVSSLDRRLVLWRGDITTLKIDAIVNAANSALRGCFVPCHSCVDNIIHSSGRLTDKHCRQLADCYQSCLKLAAENGLKSIAFCCISTGEFHFPQKKAAEIAVRTVRDYLKTDIRIEKVVFNIFKQEDYDIYRELIE